MSTLQEIKDSLGKSVNYTVKRDSDQKEFIVSHHDASSMYMKDGTIVALTASGWTYTAPKGDTPVETGFSGMEKGRLIIAEMATELQVKRVASTITSQNLIDFHTLNSSTLMILMSGHIVEAKIVWDGTAVSGAFDQTMKDKYSTIMQNFLDLM